MKNRGIYKQPQKRQKYVQFRTIGAQKHTGDLISMTTFLEKRPETLYLLRGGIKNQKHTFIVERNLRNSGKRKRDNMPANIRTWIEIDKKAYLHNLEFLKNIFKE